MSFRTLGSSATPINLSGAQPNRVPVGSSGVPRGISSSSEPKANDRINRQNRTSTLADSIFSPPKHGTQRVLVGQRTNASSNSSYSEEKTSNSWEENVDAISQSFDQSLDSYFGIDPDTSDDPIINTSGQNLTSYFENSSKKTTLATASVLQSTSSHKEKPKRVDIGARIFSKPPGNNPSTKEEIGDLHICGVGEGALAGRAAAMEFSGYESERARLEASDRNALDYQRAREETLSRLEQNYLQLKEARDCAAKEYLNKYIMQLPSRAKNAIVAKISIENGSPIGVLDFIQDQWESLPDKLEIERLGREMNKALFEYTKAKMNPELFCPDNHTGHSISAKDEHIYTRPTYAEAFENTRGERN